MTFIVTQLAIARVARNRVFSRKSFAVVHRLSKKPGFFDRGAIANCYSQLVEGDRAFGRKGDRASLLNRFNFGYWAIVLQKYQNIALLNVFNKA